MSDLFAAVGIMVVISIATFLATLNLSRRMNSAGQRILPVLIVASGGTFLVWVRDSTLLAKILPFSSLIILGNWTAPFCAALAAVSFHSLRHQRWRRYWPIFALALIGLYSTILPLTGDAPQCHDEWTDGICLQSTSASCTAACAATLLQYYEIQAMESEMAELCLTRRGTVWQGLYRGLALKCDSTAFSPQVETLTADQLLEFKAPVIISVGIPINSDVPPIYAERYGWPVGQLHSVVLFPPGQGDLVAIGDPSVGREQWTINDLRVLFRGTAVWLTRYGNPIIEDTPAKRIQ